MKKQNIAPQAGISYHIRALFVYIYLQNLYLSYRLISIRKPLNQQNYPFKLLFRLECLAQIRRPIQED